MSPVNDDLRRLAVTKLTRFGLKPFLSPRVPRTLQRVAVNGIGRCLPSPAGITSRRGRLGDCPALFHRPDTDKSRLLLLYLHGGGFSVGGFPSYGKLAAALAKHSAADVAMIDYRLAPEHPYPAALQDVLSAYRALLASDAAPRDILIVGDSAGAGLALAAALAIRDQPLPPPAGLALMSPFVDLSLSGESIDGLAGQDVMLSRAWLASCAKHYANGLAPTDPRCSPLFADLSGLPPVLIQAGEKEMLLDDARRLQRAIQRAGGSADLQIYPGVGHVFQIFRGLIATADSALDALGQFAETSSCAAAAHRNAPSGECGID